MKNFSPTKKILATIIIINICVFVAYGFVFWRIYTDGQNTSKLINQASLDFQKNEVLRTAKITLAENHDFISKIDSYFIAPNGVVPFIDSVESLAKDYGVEASIGSVAVESDTKIKNDFKETLHLKVEGSGSWSNLVQFISAVEALPYRTVFDQVVFGLTDSADKLTFGGTTPSDTKKAGSSSGKWRATIDVSLLKLK